MTLYLSQKKLFVLLVLALVIGFVLAFLYDGIRVLRTLRKPRSKQFRFLNAVLISIEDFIFFTFVGAVMSILFYVTNSGKVRLFAFVMAILGFWLFRVTLSKVTYPLLLRLLYVIKLPFAVLFGVVKRLGYRVILAGKKRASKRYFQKISRLGEKGYFLGIRRL